MIAYKVKINGDSKGQLFWIKEEAEKQAQYLNDIPNGVTYSVEEIEVS